MLQDGRRSFADDPDSKYIPFISSQAAKKDAFLCCTDAIINDCMKAVACPNDNGDNLTIDNTISKEQ